MKLDGSLLFAKYAFSPNKLKYCGPGDNRAIFDYCVAQQSDQGLVELLEKFEGAYPYLELIANSNQIKDKFNWRVVEAYWIGNELLNNVDMGQFYQSLKERFGKKIKAENLKWLLPKPAAGAKPHHSFHVFDVYTKTGMIRSGVRKNVVETIDSCRIGWGKITQNAKRKTQNHNLKLKINKNTLQVTSYKLRDSNKLIIEYQPIVFRKGKLGFGEPKEKEIIWQSGGKGFVGDLKVGDWVSFHWGWVCDRLDSRQLKNLQYWTQYHLEIANKTI